MCKESLLKLLNSANKLILEHVHSCINAIIENVISIKFLGKIVDEFRSKNPAVRSKCSEYIDKILESYPMQVIEKSV